MKHNEWIDSMTPHLKLDMKETAHQAYTNGCSLIDDAELLYQANRYARAMALAVLAEEEFSKAFILRLSLNDNRWDSTIYQSLRRHSNKQGIAESMRDFFKVFLNDYPMEINKNEPIFTQALPSMPLRSDIMDEHIRTGKKRFKKPIKDFMKQEGFYVGLDRNAKTTSLPSSITSDDAEDSLDEARKFKVIVELVDGNTSNLGTLINNR